MECSACAFPSGRHASLRVGSESKGQFNGFGTAQTLVIQKLMKEKGSSITKFTMKLLIGLKRRENSQLPPAFTADNSSANSSAWASW